MKRLKLLILPKWYPNNVDILDGVFVVDHVKAIQLNHDAFVLFVHSDHSLKEKRRFQYSEEKGYPEMIVYFRSPKTKSRHLNKFLTGLRYLQNQFIGYKAVKKKWGQPTITHVHVLLRSSFLALWLKWRYKIPYLITEHWSGYDPTVGYKIGRFKFFWLKFMLKRSAGVTTVSSYLAGHIRPFATKTPFFVVSNAIDESLFQIGKKSINEKTQIIHISTLDDYPKNFGALLNVIGTLSQIRNDFVFNVIGKGVEAARQEQRAIDLGILNKTVFFKGYLPKEEIAHALKKSDLMLLYSHYETQSCVLLEAFLTGVPVIASKVGGVSEIVTSTNGKLITLGEDEALLRAIIEFLDGKIQFDSQKIRAESLRYSYQQIGEEFSRIYQSIMTK